MGRSKPSKSIRCCFGPLLRLSRSAAVRRRRCCRRRCRRRCSVAYVTRRWQVVCSKFRELSTTFYHRFSASFRRDFCVKKIEENNENKTKNYCSYIFLPVCVKRKTVCVINEAYDVNNTDTDDDHGRLAYLLMLITDLCNSAQNSHDFSAKKATKTKTKRDNVCIVSIFYSLFLVFLFSF